MRQLTLFLLLINPLIKNIPAAENNITGIKLNIYLKISWIGSIRWTIISSWKNTTNDIIPIENTPNIFNTLVLLITHQNLIVQLPFMRK